VADDEDDEPNPHSTIVRRGKAAFSFSEMGRFVKDLEARPLERLVADLAGLLEMPDAKYGLVAMVLGKRMRHAPVERKAIEAALRGLLTSAGPGLKKRCEDLLKPPV
jgi:hypothetical protein